MKKKNLFALFMAGTMLASSLPMQAKYEDKVELKEYPFSDSDGWCNLENVIVDKQAKPETTFEVSGKKFILLDTDESGDYLIVSADNYFYPWFVNGYEGAGINRIFHRSVKQQTDDGTFTYTQENVSDEEVQAVLEQLKFNPNLENSIGYWLNNTYLNDTTKVPEAVKNKVVSKTWTTEGFTFPNNTRWIPNDFRSEMTTGMGQDENGNNIYKNNQIDYYRRKLVTDNYTVDAKVVLPSYSEYLAYGDKIPVNTVTGDWRGEMLRTISASVHGIQTVTPTDTDASNEWDGYVYMAPILVVNADATTKVWLEGYQFGCTAAGGTNYLARPMFYVSSDFFKTVKVQNPGADVKAEINKCSLKELTSIYSAKELTEMGYEIPEALQGYLNYPKHTNMVSGNLWGVTTGIESGASPAENVFYVDGKGFVILDRDADGNYFVISEDEYGTHEYTKTPTSEMVINESGYIKDSEWVFDPNNEKSVAHWLNDEGDDGFVKTRSFPKVVYDNIVPYDWQTETRTVWSLNGEPTADNVGTDAYRQYKLYKNQVKQAGSTSSAEDPRFKIALISETEFIQYKDKIGSVKFRGVDDWAGFITRSSMTRIEVNNGAISLTNYIGNINGANGNRKGTDGAADTINSPNVKMQFEANQSWWSNWSTYRIRPVFWLDKDFFKKVRVDNWGTNVVTQIKQYSREDLKGLYTAEEMDTFGLPYLELSVRGAEFTDAQNTPLETLNGATTVRANAEIVSKDGGSADMYVAVYDGEGKLVKAVEQNITIEAGLHKYELSVDGISCGTNYNCKVFVWHTDSMVPIGMVEFNK